MRDCNDTLIQYVDGTNDRDIQCSYEHLRTLRELIIRRQYQRCKQLKLDSFFNRRPALTAFQTTRSDSQPLSPSASSTPPLSPYLRTSTCHETTSCASEDFLGFFEYYPLCVSTVRSWQKNLLSTTNGELNLPSYAIF